MQTLSAHFDGPFIVLDELGYALYGLTPEEIKLVESASVQTSARQGSSAK